MTPNAAAQGRASTTRAKHDDASRRVPCSRMLCGSLKHIDQSFLSTAQIMTEVNVLYAWEPYVKVP
jgi:hypothetical protein